MTSISNIFVQFIFAQYHLSSENKYFRVKAVFLYPTRLVGNLVKIYNRIPLESKQRNENSLSTPAEKYGTLKDATKYFYQIHAFFYKNTL